MSVGIGVRKWVSYHGIGININTDLTLFKMIRPCGMDVLMTSLKNELGREFDMGDMKRRMISICQKEFEL
jgi:lipoate-protein ligase B